MANDVYNFQNNQSSKDDLYDEAVALVIREREQVLHLFKGI